MKICPRYFQQQLQRKPQALLHLFVKSKKKESPGFHKNGFLHSMNTEKAEI